MAYTKKYEQLVTKLEKYNLKLSQLEPLLKNYRKHKDEVQAIDSAQRFKDINEGKKVRDFFFVYKEGCDKKRGVYKLTIGKKFYIGRSKYIATRFKQHWKEINKFFTSGKYPPDSYLKKVFEHLEEDQWSYYFEVSLLDECYTVDELVEKEQKWLDKYNGHPNCLNIGFKAKKITHEIDETPEEQWNRKANTGVVRRGGRLVFFVPKDIKSDVIDGRSQSVKKHTPQKKKKAIDFSLEVPELNSKFGPTVYKLYYDNIYIVNKGKALSGSLFLIQKGLGYFLAYDHHRELSTEKDYWFKFYDFIRKNPNKEFRVEVILHSDDPYEILVTEQKELDKCLKDKKCYNNNIQSYIPTLNPKTGQHGWITTEQVARFYEFLASK